MTDLASLMPAVAEKLWGPPKSRTPHEWRYGDGRTISPVKGVWSDFHAGDKIGGGVIDLVKREMKTDLRGAMQWLEANGYIEGENRSRDAGPRPAAQGKPAERVVATYDYTDETGRLIYQVCRLEDDNARDEHGKPKKRFMQRQPDGRGGWTWNLQGVTPTLFCLPEIQEAIAQDNIIFIVEGEKCVEALAELGVPATCNSGGAGKWRPEFSDLLVGADVVILPDNDETGQKHATTVAESLAGKAKRVRKLDLPGLPAKGDVADWIRSGGTVERLYDMAQAAPEPGKEPYVSPFGAIPYWELDSPGPEHEWLVKGMVALAEVGLLAGESGAGKSFIGIDMGYAVARGTSWMGKRVEPGLVLYNAGEGGLGAKQRLRAYRNHHGLRPDERIPFVLLPKTIDLYSSDDHTDKLIQEARHWGEQIPDQPLRLIVIDTFSASTPGADENAAKDMSVVLARGKRLADDTRATVVFVQHLNASGEKVRGWTGIKANVDSVLICRPSGSKDDRGRDVFELELDKCKDGKRGIKWQYVLDEIELGIDRHGDPVTSCVIGMPSGAPDTRPDYSTFSTSMRDTFAAIKKAIEEAGEKTPGGLALPSSVTRVTTLQAVVSAYKRHILVVDKDADDVTNKKAEESARKSIQRGGADLKDRGYIGRESRWIWLTGKEPTTPGSARKKPEAKR